MHCPVCGQAMNYYKEEPCSSRKKKIEYKRTLYRCEQDDTWGRIEVPVGPIKAFDQARAPAIVER